MHKVCAHFADLVQMNKRMHGKQSLQGGWSPVTCKTGGAR